MFRLIRYRKRKNFEMKFFFFAFLNFACASSIVDFNTYEGKLRAYQNLTNLDEASFNAILKNGLQNRKWL